jgi:hypothetical protein
MLTGGHHKMQHKMQHHLITMDILHDRLRVHGFLRCDNAQSLVRAADKIADVAEQAAEELGVRLMPLMLSTVLSANGKKIVRDAVLRYIPEAKETFQAATNYHLMIWIWEPDKNPDDAQLMALH